MQIVAYEIRESADFSARFERLTKKKRFFTLPDQIEEATTAFMKGEFEGDLIRHSDFPVPHDVYKLRLPNPDANTGKSGGYRVLYMVATKKRLVFFMTIYYKKEEADLPDRYIEGLIDGCLLEMLPDNED